MSDFCTVNMSALLGMVWFVLRSVEANSHEMDGGYSDGFVVACLEFIAIGFNQGHTLCYLYCSQLKQTAMKWMVVIAIAL